LKQQRNQQEPTGHTDHTGYNGPQQAGKRYNEQKCLTSPAPNGVKTMSHYMTALAMKQRGLKPATKIVLYWLADHHNGETGKCFPSLSRLCECAEMGKTALTGHLNTLEQAGMISRHRTKRADGGWSSTDYILHLDEPLVRNADDPCSDFATPLVRNADTNLGSKNLGIEPNLYPSDDRFADFWEMYPRKIGKAQAQKRWRLVTKNVPVDTILDGLRSQLPILKEKDTQFIPHASTWLNQERWNDEPSDLGKPSETRTTGNRGAHDSLVAGFANYASRQSD